jgi:protein TonB
VFDEVTKKESGKNAARRAGFVFGSTAFQVGVVAAAVIAGQQIKQAVEEKVVDVKFVRTAPPTPPPPPPPPAPLRPKSKPNAPKPPSDMKLPPPPPPQALIQPKDVQEEMKEDKTAKEPEYNYGPSAGEGVVGGVVGARPSNEIEDAPVNATAGYTKPGEVDKGCVAQSTRVPKELQGLVDSVVIQFSVNKDGTVSRFSTLTDVPDKRIADRLWQAVQSCKFKVGLDSAGHPVSIWLRIPIRFQSG